MHCTNRAIPRRFALLAVVLLAGLAAIPAAAFNLMSKSNAWLLGKDLNYFAAGNGFSKAIGPGYDSDSWGDVDCDWYGCWGAKAWANGGLDAGIWAGYGLGNTMTTGALAGLTSRAALWPGSALYKGAPFVLVSEPARGDLISNFGKGRVQLGAGAGIQAGASIGAKLCVGYCISDSVGLPTINKSWDILKYDTAAPTVTFMGKTQPFPPSGAKVTSEDGLFSFVFDKATMAGGAIGNHTSFKTTQSLGGVYANAAAAAAKAYGLPKEAISGSVLGINYETVNASLGIALNLEHKVKQDTSSFFTRYRFSGSVETYDLELGAWKPVTGGLLDLRPGSGALLRAPDAWSLGILPELHLGIETKAEASVEAGLAATLGLLRVNGRGINTALYKESFELMPLGSLASVSQSASFELVSEAKPFGLKFWEGDLEWKPGETFNGFVLVDLPYGGAHAAAAGMAEDVVSGEIRQAINYGLPGCDDANTRGCRFDPDFDPIPVSYRVTYDDLGNPIIEMADDFDLADRLLATTEGPEGIQPDADYQRRLLRALLPDGGSWSLPELPPGEPPILPPPVPEPSTWVLLVAGLGVVGLAANRRKDKQRARQA